MDRKIKKEDILPIIKNLNIEEKKQIDGMIHYIDKVGKTVIEHQLSVQIGKKHAEDLMEKIYDLYNKDLTIQEMKDKLEEFDEVTAIGAAIPLTGVIVKEIGPYVAAAIR